MENKKYEYFIIIEEYHNRIFLIDRPRKVIFILKEGTFINYNKEIEENYKTYKIRGFGNQPIEKELLQCFITGEERYLTSGYIIMKTDIQYEFDLKILEIKKYKPKKC